MSFKTKRWALMRKVAMADHIPGIQATDGTGGGGWAVPFGGKIVVMAYAADGTPLYTFYDPLTDTVSGTTLVPELSPWYFTSTYHGVSASWVVWKDKYLLICPGERGYYFADSRFCGFDAGLTFHNPPFLCEGKTTGYMAEGIGVHHGEPCFVSYQYKYISGVGNVEYALVKHTLAGTSVVWEGQPYFHLTSGSRWIGMRLLEGFWIWRHADGYVLYAEPPLTVDDPYLLVGNIGTSWAYPDEAARGFTPDPAGGGTWLYITPTSGSSYWAQATSPLAAGDRPWGGYPWEYRRMVTGGYSLDEHDLDGISHGIVFADGPGTGPVIRLSNGWYAGISYDHPTSFRLYVLDPEQPRMQARTVRKVNQATACFAGDYAIGDDLKLAHVLPFPDERNPSGESLPPQDRRDGYIVGHKELFRRSGNKITYERDMKLKFEGYVFGENWWWPDENPDHTLDTTLRFFAGGRMVMGRYPDTTYGMYSPSGADMSAGLGVPQENLKAQEPDPLYVVRNNQIVDGTQAWVLPQAGIFSTGYSILRGSLTDARLCYYHVYIRPGIRPTWRARAGMVVGDEWHNLVNFNELGMPELGQDGWTVQAVCPIPPCRSLTKGGWLVLAQLYFAPWDTWELDPGPRDLTFRDTGQGWVPAKPGYVGPLEIEDWSPKLLTAADEWQMNRSDYGPAALLVYDNEGEFVECLNDETMYPPQAGPEIAVLPGSVPRLIYRVKGGGTYSDCAEYWGCYQNNSGEADFQAPLFAVYELERDGRIQVGAGAFLGFVDMYEMERYELKEAGWRWDHALKSAIEGSYASGHPKNIWAPYGRVRLREGVGGSGLTLLSPRGMSTRSGVRGRGYRS